MIPENWESQFSPNTICRNENFRTHIRLTNLILLLFPLSCFSWVRVQFSGTKSNLLNGCWHCSNAPQHIPISKAKKKKVMQIFMSLCHWNQCGYKNLRKTSYKIIWVLENFVLRLFLINVAGIDLQPKQNWLELPQGPALHPAVHRSNCHHSYFL